MSHNKSQTILVTKNMNTAENTSSMPKLTVMRSAISPAYERYNCFESSTKK